MEHLRELDDVAYVRFASVYRNFREAKDFRAALDELSGEDDGRPARQRAQMSDAGRACDRDEVSDDERFMQLALALGRRGLGRTWPNPAVGAVIVKDGVIVGRGWTKPAAGRMPRPRRLRRAGKAAQGATLYVTLEPCSHHGKTPPCADAIIARRHRARRLGAGGSQSGSRGAGPCAAARGRHRGRVGLVRRRGAPRRMPATSRASRKGRPHVTLKLAVSADGKAGLAGRKPAGDHRRGGARARASDARGEATPSWSASAPCWPTIRS